MATSRASVLDTGSISAPRALVAPDVKSIVLVGPKGVRKAAPDGRFVAVPGKALGNAALNGADALDTFINFTQTPLLKFAEAVIVVALALHMALGVRVLAIEFFAMRERTSVCG